jgi:hypothetical protein
MRQLAYVLALFQAAKTVLGGLGEFVVMGFNPVYLVLPAIRTALLVVAAGQLPRRWAAVLLIVLEALSLLGFWLSVGLGVLPWLSYPVNLAGVISDIALPGSVLLLAVVLLARPEAARS